MKRAGDQKLPTASITTSGFFVLRTPLLPFDALVAFGEGLQAPKAAGTGELETALAADRQLLRARLGTLLERADVCEALFLASRSLHDSLDLWRQAPDTERGQKIERSLTRYLARMSARATPFGLFAGCSLGRIGATTQLELADSTEYRRHARIDGDLIGAVSEALALQPALRPALRFRPNTSIFRSGAELHYAETRLEGTRRTHHLVSIDATDPVVLILERAKLGATAGELAAPLVHDEITAEAAEAFVRQLIDAQLLVPDLQAPVTGPEPIHDLIAQLEPIPAARGTVSCLAGVRDALAELDSLPLGIAPSRYDDISRELASLPQGGEAHHPFQVDLRKPVRAATLEREVVSEILEGVELLRRMARPPDDPALSQFRKEFARRYEGREVPLLEVLDDEIGIGFDRSRSPACEVSPLLDGIGFDPVDDGAEPHATGRTSHLLWRKLEAALRGNAREFHLDRFEIEEFLEQDPAPFPASSAAIATIAAPASGRPKSDFLVWLRAVDGPSGARLLGRFCHGDAELTPLVLEHLREEDRRHPGAVCAEIVHLPNGRTGNVLLRPVLRDWEIPYLGRSGAPIERQMAVDDLLVSLEQRRIVLRSRRTGMTILPRLTSAHSYGHPLSLPVYRFLCSLQRQECVGFMFPWGRLESSSFLPRVRAGRLVLALAQWRLGKEVIDAMRGCGAAARYALIQHVRRERNIPRWVSVVDGDQRLPIDLENPLSVEDLVRGPATSGGIALVELFEPERLAAVGPEGRYVHELIVPLLGPALPPERSSPPRRARLAGRHEPRLRPPGSDWLYAKVYAGPSSVDALLGHLAETIQATLASGAASRWFFVRYGDPDWHLRLRFRGERARLLQEVLPALERAIAPRLGDGRVWKLQLDTYEREIERYGGEHGISLAEEIFHADSDACLELLSEVAGDAGADARWRTTLLGMDLLLDDLGLDLGGKADVVQAARGTMAGEFRHLQAVDRAIGARFRAERRQLEDLLFAGVRDGGAMPSCIAALRRRSERIRPIAAALRAGEADGRLQRPLRAIAGSYLHMNANRMFHAAARAQELVLYDFLGRLYDGKMARSRSTRVRIEAR